MKQRLLIILLTLLTTMTVWADVNLVASPAEGGTIAFAPDNQNPNNLDYNNLVVIPKPGFYIENVIHEFSEGGNILTPDPMTGYYYVNSALGGTVTAYFNAKIRVSFDLNGHPNAANAPVFQDRQLGQKVTRPTPDPTDNGYVFVGWYMDAACTTPYDFEEPLNISLNYIFNSNRFNLTLYARWAKENCTVTFKANGGTGSMDAVTKDGGTKFEIPSCSFSYGIYVCVGWATSADGGVVYKPEEKITLIDDLTLYAKWSYPQTEFTLNGLKYKSNIQISPTVSLIGYDGSQPTGDLVIPGSVTYGGTEYTVTTIGNYAFHGCTGLTSVTIGDGVTTIGNYAFHGCTGLTSVTIGDGVTTIGVYAFYDCTGLTSVTIPSSVTTIGNSAFNGCTGLTSVTIPSSVTTIGVYAFYDCTGLTSVTIPSSVTTIGNSAFNGCTGLTSVTIPSSVTTIGESAFRNTGLTSVTIPSSVKTIGEFAFYGCTGLTSVTIPSSVTTIGYSAFRVCTGLTSVTIPSSVKTIGESAFYGCTGLTSVTIPEGVTTIGESAFDGCTGLTSVTIPEGVTTIGNFAFLGCTGLTSVTIFAPSLTKYGYLAFDSNAEGRKIYVPSGSVDKYKAGWSDFASDIEPLHYIIDEGNDVSNLNMSNGTGKNVALKRSFAKGKKQTVCLPYAPKELLNYGKVWAFTGINEGKAVMTEITDATSLQANTPYIFEASNDLLNITFPSVNISIGSDPKTAPSGAGFTFHGTYAEKTWEATSNEVTQGKIYGFMAQDNDGQTTGQFVKARRKTILRPFSCWLEYNGELSGTQNSAARRTTRSADETLPDVIDIVWLSAAPSTTGIHAAEAAPVRSDDWYSLDGRRLSVKPSVKGVYINNGRKVVIQ